jgi:hypothetical protein
MNNMAIQIQPKIKTSAFNRLAMSAALYASGMLISTALTSASVGAADSAPVSPVPAQAAPATIPGVPLPNPSAQPASREGGSAQDLLNSKNSTDRSCKDANGITVYPSDPNYKTKCATRHPRHPRVRIPIPGDN